MTPLLADRGRGVSSTRDKHTIRAAKYAPHTFGDVDLMRKEGRSPRLRLGLDQWLQGGLEALCEEGIAGLLTESLAARLGVTTGSFYWHFTDRDDFYTQLVEYWSRQMTDNLIEAMEAAHLSPAQQLCESFLRVNDERLSRYETPLRAWALTNAKARQETARVDRKRLEYVRQLLERLGYRGRQLEMRARTLLLAAMAEPSFFLSDPAGERREWLRLRLEMVIGQAPAVSGTSRPRTAQRKRAIALRRARRP